MIDERFVFVGFVLGLIGAGSYVVAVLKGKAKPNRVTWALWALAPLIGFAAQIDKGVGLQSLLTFSVGFGPLMVFTASFFNKKSYWKLKKMDYVFGALALIGIILWQVTGEGLYAIAFAILADLFAGVPTLVKSFYHPETESSTVFGLAIINSGITLLTVDAWKFEEYGFALYIFLLCGVLFGLIRFKLGSRLLAAKAAS